MKKHTRWISIAVALAFVAIGITVASRLNPSHAAESATKDSVVRQSVEVIKLKRDTLSRSLDVPATIEAIAQTDLYAKIAGYVSEVSVDIGDHVKAGQVVAVMDEPELKNELEQAKADQSAKIAMIKVAEANRKAADAAVKSAEAVLKAADSKIIQAQQAVVMAHRQVERYKAELALKELTLKRREGLLAASAVTEQETDDARMQAAVGREVLAAADAQVTSAEADLQSARDGKVVAAQFLETAKAQALSAAAQIESATAQRTVADATVDRAQTMLDYRNIVAPFDGIVTRRMVEKGVLAQPVSVARTMPLLTIQKVDTMRLFIEAPEVDVAFIKHGTPVKIKPFGAGVAPIDAQVRRVALSLNPSTRTMRVEIDIPNPNGKLLHGMYATVSLELDKRENALWIPATALLVEGGEKFAYVVENEIAVRKPLVTGLDDGIRIEVKNGLTENDWVVQTGKSLIAPNSPVKAVPK